MKLVLEMLKMDDRGRFSSNISNLVKKRNMLNRAYVEQPCHKQNASLSQYILFKHERLDY